MSDETRREEAVRQPADRVQDGRVKGTIWQRSSESGPAFATKITRTYTDKEGQPRDTEYFSGADLLRVARVAEKAYEREQELLRERRQNPEHGEDAGERDERKITHRSLRQRGTRRPHNRTRE